MTRRKTPRPVPLWSPSASSQTQVSRATAGAVRILSGGDTAALHALLDTDPIAHVSVAAAVHQRGTAARGKGRSSALLLGMNSPDSATLASACWVGSNVIPVAAGAAEGELFGRALRALRRRVSSIYGRSQPVQAILDATGWSNYREVRDAQPLMWTDAPAADVEPLAGVRTSRMEEFDAVEQACAAMFTEELGFSPYEQGAALYRDRIRSLIRAGHSLISVDPQSLQIVFKAEFGAVTNDVVQVQGVWVNPGLRGRGIAAPGMAAVINHGLQLAPQVSLYVNSYNTAAIRAYERVGFRHCGTYTTVLF